MWKTYPAGLSVTRKIIELHRGTLQIASGVNNGTKITISLPGQTYGL